MAAKIGTATSLIGATTNLVQGNSNYSCTVWFKPDSDDAFGNFNNLFTHINAGYTAWAGIFTSPAAAQDYHVSADNGGGTVNTATKSLTSTKWYPIGYVRNGTVHTFYYLAGLTRPTAVKDMSAVVFTQLILGFDGFSVAHGSYQYFREWNTSLSIEEMKREMNSTTVQKTANLWRNCPMIADLLDISGHGYDLTGTGTVTFVAGPTLIANNSPATAIDMTGLMPYVNSQSVAVDDYISTAWYKYTAQSTDRYLGMWGYAGRTTSPEPLATVYNSDAITTYINSLQNIDNIPFQMPLVVGNTFYFKFSPDSEGSQYTLAINALLNNGTTFNRGNIFLNDDSVPFWIYVIDPTTNYTIKAMYNLPATLSELGGDILENNKIALVNDFNSRIDIFQGLNPIPLTSVVTPVPSLTTIIRTCITPQVWYISKLSPPDGAKVYKLDQDGTVTLKATLPSAGIVGCAASNDETIIYVTGQSGSINAPIKRWEVASSSFLTDLAPGFANYASGDILVLGDGTICALFVQAAAGNDAFIKIYNPAGTVLFTVSLGAAGHQTGNLWHDILDPAFFWARVHDIVALGITSIFKIRVSDGTIISTSNYAEFENGKYSPAETSSPLARFGPAESCPAFMLRSGSGPGGALGGIYKIVKDKRQDTLWASFVPPATTDVKIPDPQFKTALLGD